jgi:hypothetical protein
MPAEPGNQAAEVAMMRTFDACRSSQEPST